MRATHLHSQRLSRCCPGGPDSVVKSKHLLQSPVRQGRPPAPDFNHLVALLRRDSDRTNLSWRLRVEIYLLLNDRMIAQSLNAIDP